MNITDNRPNVSTDHYAVIDLRMLDGKPTTAEELAALILAQPKAVIFNESEGKEEFFVLKLKDANADVALEEYALKAAKTDQALGQWVMELAQRSGKKHPYCKRPD